MPLIITMNDDNEPVRRYTSPLNAGLYSWHDDALQALKERRRFYSIAQQELRIHQKALSKDRESARWLKETIKMFQRQQKAAQLWIDWFETVTDLRFTNWPLELASELDSEINAYELKSRE